MIEQRSLEWFEARRGLITCSRLADVIANSNAYLRDLKLERDGQQIDRDVDAAALNWGKETEPKAIAAYEFANDCDVEPAEFRVSTDREYLAGSADGLVNTSGMIEVKCPFDEGIHTLTLLNGMPETHVPQIQGYLHVYDRQWCDFVSFDPRITPKRRLFVQRIERDDQYIAWMLERVDLFWRRVLDLETMPDPLDANTIPKFF